MLPDQSISLFTGTMGPTYSNTTALSMQFGENIDKKQIRLEHHRIACFGHPERLCRA